MSIGSFGPTPPRPPRLEVLSNLAPLEPTQPGMTTPGDLLMSWSTNWRSELEQPDPQKLAELHQDAIDTITELQKTFTPQGGTPMRAQHAKALYTTANAGFRVQPDLPPAIAYGPFTPGNSLRAIVRISSVSGTARSDDEPDLRGIAIRLTDDQGHIQDILMNTSEQFMAKDATAALAGARARGGGFMSLLGDVFGFKVGPIEAIKMAWSGRSVESKDISLAAHTFWSRTPFQLGEHAVKLRLVPVDPTEPEPRADGEDELSQDLDRRLASGVVRYKLQVQGYRDPQSTPLNDARESWDSPWVTVGELVLPWDGSPARQAERPNANYEIDQLAYSITNRWDESDSSLKGLGEINAIREIAYQTSATGRGVAPGGGKGCPFGFGQ